VQNIRKNSNKMTLACTVQIFELINIGKILKKGNLMRVLLILGQWIFKGHLHKQKSALISALDGCFFKRKFRIFT
jgi:hypothetical protein